jgi:hypothetical protein
MYDLARISESKWQQRSSTKWLKLGDNNTTYFHAIASNRRKINHVPLIENQHSQTPITHTSLILEAFSSYYKDLLGIVAPHHPISDLSLNIPSEVDLSPLATPFTEVEISRTIYKLSKRKACGPDGFPSEFFQKY